MASRVKYRDVVREIGLKQYGFLTPKDAVAAGVPAVELPKLAARGGLENVAYGLYRVPNAPATRYDRFAEALLRVGDGAFLHGESVLALFGLADANPRHVYVTTTRRVRRTMPDFVKLTHAKYEVETTRYEGLECQPVADAFAECHGRVDPEHLLAAAEQAHASGKLRTTAWEKLKKELRP
ncbi:hypothetical protein BJF85_09775 [Saccharomonospora sp. CUA-673]|uniref:hypothetical protein n=1 Tax=Saccharomonospora sp. CUA-673 TaxID=1904969 RepID=UPI000968876F|nr:hypothetical protein [Saccharomonospora sp. CUA-673]OLT49163.1 hypothetical protein BJF85_09775 [Saccharomonospora sp. CUA-673]